MSRVGGSRELEGRSRWWAVSDRSDGIMRGIRGDEAL